MTTKVTLGIDQGSSSTKGVLMAPTGEVLASTSIPVQTTFGSDGAVDQDPEELLASLFECRRWADAWCVENRGTIDGIGFSFQRSGAVAWEGNKSLSPYLSWRDTRLQPLIDNLKQNQNISEYVQQVAGVPLLPGFAGVKLAYLQREFPLPAHTGTLDTFVISQLFKRTFVSSEGLASRSLLYSLESGDWDARLCEILSADRSRMATVVPVYHPYGVWAGIPVLACLGDKQASLVSALHQGYRAVLNLGTISSLCLWCGEVPVVLPGVTTGVVTSAYGAKKTFQLEVGTQVSGDVFDILKQEPPTKSMVRTIPDVPGVASSEPILFAAPRGTGFPDYRGPLPICISPFHANDESILRELYLENVGFTVANMIVELQKRANVGAIDRMIVNGGGSNSPTVMRSIAAGINLSVDCSDQPESSAWGAALTVINRCRGIEADQIPPRSPSLSCYPPEDLRRERYVRWQALRAHVLSHFPR